MPVAHGSHPEERSLGDDPLVNNVPLVIIMLVADCSYTDSDGAFVRIHWCIVFLAWHPYTDVYLPSCPE